MKLKKNSFSSRTEKARMEVGKELNEINKLRMEFKKKVNELNKVRDELNREDYVVQFCDCVNFTYDERCKTLEDCREFFRKLKKHKSGLEDLVIVLKALYTNSDKSSWCLMINQGDEAEESDLSK